MTNGVTDICIYVIQIITLNNRTFASWENNYEYTNRDEPKQVTNIKHEFNVKEIHNLNDNPAHKKEHYEIIEFVIKEPHYGRTDRRTDTELYTPTTLLQYVIPSKFGVILRG